MGFAVEPVLTQADHHSCLVKRKAHVHARKKVRRFFAQESTPNDRVQTEALHLQTQTRSSIDGNRYR